MLDTDTVSYALRDVGRVAEMIKLHSPSGICISSITLAELRMGASLKRSKRIHAVIGAFVSQMPVMPFDDEAATRFGEVAAALVHSGQSIGELDAMIAAHAMDLDATLVTNNTRHFRRVKGLRFVSWA